MTSVHLSAPFGIVLLVLLSPSDSGLSGLYVRQTRAYMLFFFFYLESVLIVFIKHCCVLHSTAAQQEN